jgi:DNA polymerase IV
MFGGLMFSPETLYYMLLPMAELHNHTNATPEPRIMFIDMNSFFASCEQQVNFYLRGRPVGVCVYPGRYGAVISPSIEAKAKGVKTGMRLDEAMQLCPDLVPLETNPQRYRDYHVKIIHVLKKYCEEVVPKSIDEAILDFSKYRYVYKTTDDLLAVAKKIKSDIRREVGDWLKCSIGLAPNAFLAKLGSELKKPDGLSVISPENIDEVLGRLKLTDLPGIASRMAERLQRSGIHTPLQLRHTPPDVLRRACHSIVGTYWHYRLNFSEVDLLSKEEYKSMQAMRQVSKQQREKLSTLHDLFIALCMKLEQRMVRQEVYCRDIVFSCRYENGNRWKEHIVLDQPCQDGMDIHRRIMKRMEHFRKQRHCEPVINHDLTRMGVTVCHFVPAEVIQCDMFEDNVRQHRLRKTVYDIKERYGKDKILKAAELQDEPVMRDVIGFGSVKDLVDDDYRQDEVEDRVERGWYV